jgi:hypothetical protein
VNFYEYVYDNPTKFRDPTGMQVEVMIDPEIMDPIEGPIEGPSVEAPPSPGPSAPANWDPIFSTGPNPGSFPKPPTAGRGCEDPNRQYVCEKQWYQDLKWCDETFNGENDFNLHLKCVQNADENAERCLDGLPRIPLDPRDNREPNDPFDPYPRGVRPRAPRA